MFSCGSVRRVSFGTRLSSLPCGLECVVRCGVFFQGCGGCLHCLPPCRLRVLLLAEELSSLEALCLLLRARALSACVTQSISCAECRTMRLLARVFSVFSSLFSSGSGLKDCFAS